MKSVLGARFESSPFMKSLQLVLINIFLTIMISCNNTPKPLETSSEWQFQSQREEISPLHWIEKTVLFEGAPTLALAGDNKKYSNGSWTFTHDVVPNSHYTFTTHFKPKNVAQLNRSVLAKITWQASNGEPVNFIEFPAVRAKPINNGWYIIEQVYQVPDKVTKAKIDLVFRWSAKGSVYFGGTKLDPANSIPSRKMRIATIHHRPRNTSSATENLAQFKEYVEIAGQQKANFVCLSEGITVIGTGKSYLEVSEPIPGPTTRFLGNLSKKHNMYIIAGIYERDGPVVYNTSVLIGRNGEVEGKYRKVSLPHEEIDGGLTPGDNFPVFDTDFGRVGMMICWDLQFPEPARMLALRGAEIVFVPVWGGDIILTKARALENQIYIVTSSYDTETAVFDKNGELILQSTEENPVSLIEVDLNRRNLLPWIGEFKNRINREMPSLESIKY